VAVEVSMMVAWPSMTVVAMMEALVSNWEDANSQEEEASMVLALWDGLDRVTEVVLTSREESKVVWDSQVKKLRDSDILVLQDKKELGVSMNGFSNSAIEEGNATDSK